MATIPYTINNGTPPYSISVKRQGVGDTSERFVSYIGNTLTFNAVANGQNIYYTIQLIDANGCSDTKEMGLNCPLVIDCDTPYDIMLVIDESGSISPQEFTLMKNGIKLILDNLKTYLDSGLLRIGMYAFGSGAKPNCTRGLVALSDDYNALVGVLNSFAAQGWGTPIASGLRDGHNLLVNTNTRNNNKKIILITDGDPNGSEDCSDIPLAQARTVTKNRADTIKASLYNGQYTTEIITVGIAITNDNSTWLQNNVASTPSDHFNATTFNDFVNISDAIAAKMCE